MQALKVQNRAVNGHYKFLLCLEKFKMESSGIEKILCEGDKAAYIMGKSMNSGARLPRFESQLSRYPGVLPLTGCFPSAPQ